MLNYEGFLICSPGASELYKSGNFRYNSLMGKKRCVACKSIKSLTEFGKVKVSNDKHNRYCKVCNAAKSKEYRYKYPERDKGYKHNHYQKHREQYKKNTIEWRKKNTKRYTELNREYHEKNRERLNKQSCLWAKRNPEKTVQYAQKRRALKLRAEGSFSANEFKELCEKYNNLCLCCKEEQKLTADHVIALTKGGSNYISNIQPLCRPCNSSKGVKDTDYR